jgi:hypothetical protein
MISFTYVTGLVLGPAPISAHVLCILIHSDLHDPYTTLTSWYRNQEPVRVYKIQSTLLSVSPVIVSR